MRKLATITLELSNFGTQSPNKPQVMMGRQRSVLPHLQFVKSFEPWDSQAIVLVYLFIINQRLNGPTKQQANQKAQLRSM